MATNPPPPPPSPSPSPHASAVLSVGTFASVSPCTPRATPHPLTRSGEAVKADPKRRGNQEPAQSRGQEPEHRLLSYAETLNDMTRPPTSEQADALTEAEAVNGDLASAAKPKIKTGRRVLCKDAENLWYHAKVASVRKGYALVSYEGWSSEFDEWVKINSGRFKPPLAEYSKPTTGAKHVDADEDADQDEDVDEGNDADEEEEEDPEEEEQEEEENENENENDQEHAASDVDVGAGENAEMHSNPFGVQPTAAATTVPNTELQCSRQNAAGVVGKGLRGSHDHVTSHAHVDCLLNQEILQTLQHSPAAEQSTVVDAERDTAAFAITAAAAATTATAPDESPNNAINAINIIMDTPGSEFVTSVSQVQMLEHTRLDGCIDTRGPSDHQLDNRLLKLITPEELGIEDPDCTVFPSKLVTLKLSKDEVIRMKQLRYRLIDYLGVQGGDSQADVGEGTGQPDAGEFEHGKARADTDTSCADDAFASIASNVGGGGVGSDEAGETNALLAINVFDGQEVFVDSAGLVGLLNMPRTTVPARRGKPIYTVEVGNQSHYLDIEALAAGIRKASTCTSGNEAKPKQGARVASDDATPALDNDGDCIDVHVATSPRFKTSNDTDKGTNSDVDIDPAHRTQHPKNKRACNDTSMLQSSCATQDRNEAQHMDTLNDEDEANEGGNVQVQEQSKSHEKDSAAPVLRLPAVSTTCHTTTDTDSRLTVVSTVVEFEPPAAKRQRKANCEASTTVTTPTSQPIIVGTIPKRPLSAATFGAPNTGESSVAVPGAKELGGTAGLGGFYRHHADAAGGGNLAGTGTTTAPTALAPIQVAPGVGAGNDSAWNFALSTAMHVPTTESTQQAAPGAGVETDVWPHTKVFALCPWNSGAHSIRRLVVPTASNFAASPNVGNVTTGDWEAKVDAIDHFKESLSKKTATDAVKYL